MLWRNAAGSNTSAHVHILTDYVTHSISYTQETRYLCCSFLCKSFQEKTPRIESPPSVKYLCTTSTPKSI